MLKIITLFCTRSILYHLLLCLPITRIHSHLQNYVGSQHYSPIFGSFPPLRYFMGFLECVYVFVTSLWKCKTVNPRQKLLLVQPPVQSDWRNQPKYEANKVTKTVNFPWHCSDVYVWLDIPWSANDRLSPLGFLLQIFSLFEWLVRADICLAPGGCRLTNIFNHFFLQRPQIHINCHKKSDETVTTRSLFYFRI